MTSEGKESVRHGRLLVFSALWIVGALLVGGCAGKHAQTDQGQAQQQQQQALDRARNLCRDFGYTPGTMEFARCAQSEYDRTAQAPLPQVAMPQAMAAPPPATAPQAAPPQSQPQPAAKADDDDWLVRWIKRPPVCAQAACSVY